MGACDSLLCSFISSIIDIINLLIPVLALVAVAVFMVSAILYITKAGDSHHKQREHQTMWWGLVALFLLFSIWGILKILDDSFFGGSSRVPGDPMDIRPERAKDPWEGLR